MNVKTKKVLILLLVLTLVLCTFLACSQKDDGGVTSPDTDDSDDDIPDIDWDAIFGGFSSKNEPQFLAYEGVEYGEDIEITYHSNVTDADKHAMVTLPYGYDESKQYPVLYLLHGMNCDHKTWLEKCNAKYIVQNLVRDKDIKEMIVVSVNSIVSVDEVAPSIFDSAYTTVFDKTGEDLVYSLMPYINEHYSTLTDRNSTAIAGFSMGGRETLLTAFAYQDYFNYVGAFSPSGFGKKAVSFDTTVPDFKYEDGKSFDVVMLAIGNFDTMTSLFYPAIDQKLKQTGIEHLSKTYQGGHDPSVWRAALFDFVQLIFTEN